MSGINPELEDALRKLDEELEEGDITKKGYEKRRTLILSQYINPQAPVLQSPVQFQSQPRGLRVHSPDDSDHPASTNDASRAASLAALTGQSVHSPSRSGTLSESYPSLNRQASMLRDEFNESRRSITPQSHVQRFQEREAVGVPRGSISGASYDGRNETFLTANDQSRSQTLLSQNYAFNPEVQQNYGPPETRNSTMLDSQQGYFSDFAGQQREDNHEHYGGNIHRYSQGDVTSPTAQMAPPFLGSGELAGGAAVHQMPLEPREVPFAICDPHDSHIEMSRFENIAAVLRHRAKTNAKQAAYWVLDQKGKELVSITWEKLCSRAEKVAQVIRDKSSLYKGDRVALIYTENEIIEFAVALLGCFIAGVVAVPINDMKNYARLNVVLTSTQAHLALTTEANLKNFQRDITAAKLNWPRRVEWWKTNEFGSYHPKKKGEEPPLVMPDLASIEFSMAPTGDLRGVVMSHKTIMHQMATLSAMITSATSNTKADTFNPSLRDKQGHIITGSRHGEIMLSYLDPRQSIGMILGVLLNIYGGHTVIYVDQRTIETPGLYANLITKYKTTLLVADYPGLKRAVYNYQADPMTTRNFKRNFEPNFSSVKLCMIDTLTVDAEFHELLADRWLKPLRNPRAREIVAPMLCLPEHGGMVISMRDWLGGEERMGCSLSHEMDHDREVEEKKEESSTMKSGFGSSLIGGGSTKPSKERSTEDLGEVLLDKEALRTNDIVVLAMGSEARAKASSFPNAVRCGAFGYPIPDATLAVVDPESGLLCTPNSIGEIWVDSPSLSGGFWALPKHTETIFHARPYCFKEGNPTPTAIDPEFLRTGLLGCVIEGKVYVLGLYEDRLRQRVEWVEHGLAVQEHRYFFVQHLILSIMKNVPKIHDCSAFDCFVNDEHLPIVLLESPSASTAPLSSGGPPQQLDIALLDSLAEKTMEILYQEHHLRVYCVLITAPGILPRVTKNGRREIGNMLCRREFDNGALPCVHVKFGVERAVQNLPVGEDINSGIWSANSSAMRADLLYGQETQWSGVDPREVVIDDRTSTALSNFTNIFDLMQWRVARQADELAYCTIDGRGKEGKGLTWKKFDQKVAAVALYLRNKVKVKPSDHLVLMYTHSEDFVFAIYACMVLGAIAIPVAPLDANRLSEDAPAYLHIVADMGVKAVLCNTDVDHLFKQKIVSQHLKQSAQYLKAHIPNVYNTTKPAKQSHGCRELGLTINRSWISPTNPVIIWTYWTPDQRRVSVQLGHDTILGMCKVQKETCQMTSSKPVLACVRSTIGIGFLHTVTMGVYNGSATYLISPLDFAQNPGSLFLALSRYKVKDTYATSQMLDFAMGHVPGKGFSLHELKNLMVISENRPRLDLFAKARTHFAQTGLERTAVNTIYAHVLNPMIASRSYMSIEPIELWLDVRALRRGLIYPVDPDTDPTALCIQDSGMVPVSTRIAVVNPETCQLCHVGEFGEIWVQSEACAKSFYMSKQVFDEERFNGRIAGGDPNATYVRTGDLGFLHNVTRPIGPGGQPVEMQILFVLGSIGETFEVNGLNHFPIDIETTIEKSHRNITPGGCAVFQAGGMVVVLVEVFRKSYLASIVPVIVNAVLHEHQIIVDIVAFVGEGDFPRSRLSEKQRGKILASWVTRKLRTIAQFGIRDADGDSQNAVALAERKAPSLASKAMSVSQHDQTRASIASESKGNPQQTDQMSSRSSIVPELPFSLPPNHYQIDPTGLYDPSGSSAQTKGVSLSDRPYTLPEGVVEMPTHQFDDPDENENPYLTDEKFFDPNGDPERQFDDNNSPVDHSRLDPAPGGPPRLSLVNPDEYPRNGSNDNTPTSYTATVTPTSAVPHTLRTPVDGGADSPYEDQGNPFRNSIPASIPSFDFITSPSFSSMMNPAQPRSPVSGAPARDQMASASAAYHRITAPPAAAPGAVGATGGRALLPSQQARFPKPSPAAVSAPGPALGPALARHPSNTSYEYPVQDLPREALQYVSSTQSEQGQGRSHSQGHSHRRSGSSSYADQNTANHLHPDNARQSVDLSSISGSVRRRYDGSAYDDYDY
jgi:acyl-CoA synthetase (AMP-forming)/AMP-acid ligase II